MIFAPSLRIKVIKKHVRLCVVGEAVVHSRSPTDSLCLEDAELPYDQVAYNLYLFLLDPGSGIQGPGFGTD